MQKITLILLLSLAAFSISYSQKAQDKIILMNGNQLYGEVSSEDSSFVYYSFEKKSGKKKDTKIDIERVFSVTDKNGQEKIYYTVDTVIGNYFSQEEMRNYVEGSYDASLYHSSNWTLAAGIPLTGAAGYVLSSTILAFPIPFVYTIVSTVPGYKMRVSKSINANKKSDPAYVLGYERTARSKRIFKSLAAGLIGTVGGFAVGVISRN